MSKKAKPEEQPEGNKPSGEEEGGGQPVDAHPFDLVVVGSSAGGIEALSHLVSSLPSTFPAPIVLAQHLDPFRPSHLESILERRSTLPVVVVSERTPLEAGKVYVVPSNQHVVIEDGSVVLETDHGDRPRPSIDLLLSTAARSYGDRLIAVILTGSGTDGADGAVEVKSAGGVVIIQNPQTARYPSMPLALPPTVVDHIVDLEQIGPLLGELIENFDIKKTAEKAADPLRDILAYITSQANIDFARYKPPTIVRRITRRMAATHVRSIVEYDRYLRRHPAEVGELVMSFLIKVSEFFRDPEAFDFLRDHVLPTLIAQARQRDRVLRFWSAGCATGEEPYSLGMLLAEVLGPELPQWSIKVFATDLDEEAIAFARRGIYPKNLLGNLKDDLRARYFEPSDHGYRISKTLRQMVIFGQQDLSRGVPFPKIDLVVCRNLLIYFKPELQQHVLDMFAYSLSRTQGFLFLGQAETTRPSQTNFELVNKTRKVYRCVRGPVQTLVARNLAGLTPAQAERLSNHYPPPVAASNDPEIEAGEAEPELLQFHRFNESVLRLLPMGVVVINRSYRILIINSAARKLLGLRDAANEQDFLHSVRGLPYQEVRGAIDAVFREHSTETVPEVELSTWAGGNGLYLNLTIAQMHPEPGQVDLALISISDVTEQVQTRKRLEGTQSEQKQLVLELSEANKRLSDINKELQDTNEAFQSANEELMLTQEELQATNEEFEATNEELQATNEELETNNEELQATNEELETTNEELQARTSELTELAKTLATERLRLAEMVELAPYYIMVLRGPQLTVEAFNPRYEQSLEGRAVIGHPLDEVFYEPEMTRFVQLVREVYTHNVTRTTPRITSAAGEGDDDAAGSSFIYTIVPAHDDAGRVDGVIIYGEDVTREVAREAAERREKMMLLVEHAEVAMGLYDANDGAFLQASPRFLDLLQKVNGFPGDDAAERTWADLSFLAPGQDLNGLFQSVIEEQATRRMPEVRLALAPGEEETAWDFSLTPIPFQESEGVQAVRFLAVSAFEVTQQVRAREELEQLDRMKDAFLSLASHELRTPLVPLMGYSDMITKLVARVQKEEVPNWDKRLLDYVSKFRSQIAQLDRLVDDLFDVARIESGKLSLQERPVNMALVVQEAVEIARMQGGKGKIQVEMAKDVGPLVVRGDSQRLGQVVSNLLSNAIKYAPDSKRIDVALHRENSEENGKEEAVFAVQDHGPGIPPEDLPLVFNRFYQAMHDDDQSNKAGLGVGLFISRAIVEQHGGTISAESTPIKGSTFTVRLPLLSQEEGPGEGDNTGTEGEGR